MTYRSPGTPGPEYVEPLPPKPKAPPKRYLARAHAWLIDGERPIFIVAGAIVVAFTVLIVWACMSEADDRARCINSNSEQWVCIGKTESVYNAQTKTWSEQRVEHCHCEGRP